MSPSTARTRSTSSPRSHARCASESGSARPRTSPSTRSPAMAPRRGCRTCSPTRLPEGRAHQPDGDAQPARAASSASSRCRASATTSSSCSARRPPRCTTRAGSSTIYRPTRRRSASRCSSLSMVGLTVAGPTLARRAAEADATRRLATVDFPFMSFRQVDLGHGPGVAVADDVHRRSRLRDLVRARVPALPVRPDLGGRRRVRHAPVRLPGPDHDAAGEELRHLVSASTARSTRRSKRAWTVC